MATLEFWPVSDEDEGGLGIPVLPREFDEAVWWCEDESRPGAFMYSGAASHSGGRWGKEGDKRIWFWFTDALTAFEFTLRYRSEGSVYVSSRSS